MRRLLAAALLSAVPACGTAQEPTLVPALERLAAAGNREAIYYLGMSYQTGSGVPVDHQRALALFRRAAALGDPLGAYKLGCFHAGQDGVLPVDEKSALANKLVAAEAGYALAQQDVAAIYAKSGDAAAARRWLERAARQGWPDALMGYATLHNGRNGLPRDAAVVVAYFTLFLQSRPGSAEQEAWLERERAALNANERARADALVAAYRPQATELTRSALSGQQAAQALIARARP